MILTNGMNESAFFCAAIEQVTGKKARLKAVERLHGGCINEAALLRCENEIFFIKWNSRHPVSFFEAEAQNLHLLQGKVCVPQVYGQGECAGHAFLLLEGIEQGAKQGQRFWENVAEQLVLLHRSRGDAFGLDYNNYIGALPQDNTPCQDGAAFFFERRLLPLIEKASAMGRLQRRHEQAAFRLAKRLPDLLPDEPPVLLHGDLWSGNVMADRQGRAVFIDPATYYGCREIDLAMMQLFGGFDAVFWEAYRQMYPWQAGFEERVAVWNLYPLLVHLILFGDAYRPAIERTLQRFGA
ncbi:MAG: fructosamine kinase [Thermonema sp.]|uniref:fructosamine kinase family protein n=1 Tax=Thermonema sp. TaxID=2231181 RepID=UPI0021DE6E96|nr:fructosamine kinase family protein [Thermonema sp.]GIV39701.1 MAG: fructosamine kinase [Thermonema sp.]